MGLRAAIAHAWDSGSRLGVAGLPRDAQRAVMGANHFLILGSLVGIPWLLAFMRAPHSASPDPAVTHLLMILTWVAALWINARRHHLLASVLALGSAFAQYGYLTYLYGRDSGFHLSLLALPTLVFVMVERHRVAIRACVILAVGAGVAYAYIDPSFAEPIVAVTDRWMRTVAVFSVLSVLTVHVTSALFNDHFLRQERRRADVLLEEAYVAADTDQLTGLLNRRGIEPELLAAATQGPYAVMLADVDRFKRINDALGHAEGDQVLRHVARVLEIAVGGRGRVARWGGEEFLVVYPGAALVDLEREAEILRRDVEESFRPADRITVTVSVGAAWAPHGLEPRHAIRVADECLYQAKADGRNLSVARSA